PAPCDSPHVVTRNNRPQVFPTRREYSVPTDRVESRGRVCTKARQLAPPAVGLRRGPRDSLFHHDFPIHPGVGRTDIVINARLREGDGLGLSGGQIACIPLALCERGGVMI